MNIVIGQSVPEVKPKTFTLKPTIVLTEEQSKDDTKQFSYKDIFEACVAKPAQQEPNITDSTIG